MAQRVSENAFRSVFKGITKESIQWFPGHMGRGLKQMQQKLRSVDCIIEVHDARIPLSGRNNDFKYKISGIKPHILVLNKSDMIEPTVIPKIQDNLKHYCSNVIFTNCKDQMCKGVGNIFPLAKSLIKNSDRYNRSDELNYCVMVIGVPNVGKSSLINTLRNRFLNKANASPVGAIPGITKSVMCKIKISENPLFYMLDTPGILTPTVSNVEVGLKLALCATIQDNMVGENIIADYLLYWLNKQRLHNYVEVFNLKGPNDDIVSVLAEIAIKEKKYIRIKNTNNVYILKPDFDWAAKYMLKTFRTGNLGKIMLDDDII